MWVFLGCFRCPGPDPLRFRCCFAAAPTPGTLVRVRHAGEAMRRENDDLPPLAPWAGSATRGRRAERTAVELRNLWIRVHFVRTIGLANPTPGTLGRVRHARGKNIANPLEGEYVFVWTGLSWIPDPEAQATDYPPGEERGALEFRHDLAQDLKIGGSFIGVELHQLSATGTLERGPPAAAFVWRSWVLEIVAQAVCIPMRRGDRQSLSDDSRGCNGGRG